MPPWSVHWYTNVVSLGSCGTVNTCVPVVDPLTPSVNEAPPLLTLIANGCPDPVVLLKIYVAPLYNVKFGLSAVALTPGPANLYELAPFDVTV